VILLDDIIKITNEIRVSKYKDAKVIFLAGSIVRGEGTPDSDLDLVVVFENLPNAYRESFYFRGFPVEAFVHDPETLNYFITERELKSGVCVMAQMVSEGIEVPERSEFSQRLKQLAISVIDSPAPKLDEESLRQMRYNITNLIDDIRHPRSKTEVIATGTALYDVLANCYLRTNGFWTAKAKSIPRKLKLADIEFSLRYCASFEKLFAGGQTAEIIALAEEILKPIGGFLFEGHKLDAPLSNRKPFAELNGKN
jgi:hypothetical protein